MRNALPSKMLLAAVFSLTLLCAATSHAANATWNGTTDAVWATGTNWSATPVPGTGDIATFNNAGGAVDTIDLGGGVTINTILFDTASAAAYTIGSGAAGSQTLTLNNGGGITMNATVNNAQQFNANIILGTDNTAQTFTVTNNNTFANAKTLTFLSQTNIISPGATNTGIKTFDVNAPGVGGFIGVSVISSIQDGAGGGTVKLVKDGEGSMQLASGSANNTYTGGTYLNAGTLYVVGNANSIKAGTSLFIAGGTSLGSVNQGSGNYSGIVQQWNGDFSFNDGTRGNAALQQMTFNTGTVDLGATGTDTVRTINALSNTLTVNSVISNGTNGTTNGLTKTGAGTMVLGGTNTYTGTTSVNAGTLTITGAPTGGGAFTVNGGILNVSGAAGTLNGSAAVNLNGGNLTLTNTTTAEGAVNRISNAAAITSNGGTLTYTNTSGAGLVYAENVGNVTLNAGQFNAVLTNNMTGGGGNKQTLTLDSLTHNNRSNATFSSAGGLNTTTNLIKVTDAPCCGTTLVGPWATTGTSATVQTDYAVYDPAGIVLPANVATALGSVTAGGSATWTDPLSTYTTGFLGGNNAANALSATAHNMASLRNAPAFGNTAATLIAIPTGGNLNTYGLLNAGQGTWTISQIAGGTGAVSTPTGGGDLYINTGNGTASGNGAITISAPINDNGGAVSIVKTGAGFNSAADQGVLALSNVTSNYSGATVINAGQILLNTTGALADGGVASSLGAASTSASNLVLNGGTLKYTGAGITATNRLFSVGLAGGTLDSSSGTAASLFSFVGTGAMGFDGQSGARTLTLTGSNTGTAASTSGSNSSQSTVALLIGDNGAATSVNKTGAGTWALTNSASTYTGPTTISQGILNVGTFAAVNTASSIGKGSVAGSAADLVLNGGTLQYSNNAAASTNRLFSVGTSGGTLDSSAASPTNTLSFTATGAMGFNNTVGTRTLTLAGTNTGANSMGLLIGDFGGLTALTKSNNGTWALGNAGNTYTGVTTINNGILSVGKLANGGVASSIGASTNLPANLVMTAENAAFTAGNLGSLLNLVQPATSISLATVAPTLKYTGTGDSTDRTIKFTIASNDRAAVLDASGTGALNFTNANFTTNATTSFSTTGRRLALVLTGGNSADYTLANTISGIITDNGIEPTSIVKTGLGTWVLAGNNTYGSANTQGFGTTVNQGTLVLSGSPTGTVKTTVNAGGTLKLDYSTNNTSKLADTTGILQLGGGTLNLSGGSHTEVVTNTTLSPGASSVIQSGGGSSTLRMNAITRQAGATIDFGAASIADTDTNNAAGVGILGAYATIGGANWAKSVDAAAADTAITAYSAYTDIAATGSSITSAATTNVRLNSAGGGGNISMAAGTTSINTLLQNTTTAATVDTASKTLATTGIMIGTGQEALTIGITPGSAGTLTAATSGGDLVLSNFNSAKTLTVNAVVGANGASTLTTGGNVTLNGVNTYTGATFVNSGTLTIAGTGSLNSGNYAGAITIAQGATLNYTSSANQTLIGGTSGFGNFIWNPSSSAAVLTAGNRGATPAVLTLKSGILSGIVQNLGTGPASDLVLDGGIIRTADGGGGTDATSRLFTLGTGGGTIQIDTLAVPGNSTRPTEFQGTGPIAFTGSGTRTLNFLSSISSVAKFSPALGDGPGGATSVTMGGGGTSGSTTTYGIWALDGANTYTGTTTVNAGSLIIRKTQSVNNGVAYFTPSNIIVSPPVNGVAGIAIGVGPGPTYFDSTAIATILDSSHLGASTATTGLKPGAQFGLDTTAGDFTYSGVLSDLPAGTNNVFNLAKHGINTLTLTGNNTYTGTTTIYGNGTGGTSQGTSILRAGSPTAFGQATTASIVFDQGVFQTINKLQLFGNNVTVIGLNSPVSVHRDGKGENYIESGSSDTSGTGTDILTINTPNATTSTWNNAQALNTGISRIQDGGARRLGITKGDLGTLELGGTNTYTGGTIINAGILRALSTTAFSSATAATLTFGSGSTGTVQLNGNSMTIVGLNTDATPGTTFVENGHASTGATLTVSNTTANTFAGVLRNGAAAALTLVKSGTGSLTLSGNNTYTGTTTVSAGTLVLSGSNASATGDITVNSGGVVQFNTTSSINGGFFNVANRDVTINAGGAAVFGPSFGAGIADVQTALLNRIVAGSAGAIAADNYAGSNFDFSAAGLTAASLGAVGSVNYTGTLTPNGGIYRLGGGGGTLTYPTIITGSPLTVTGASTGKVVLSNVGNTLGTLTMTSGVLDLNGTTTQTAGSVVLAGSTLQNGTLTGTSYSGTGGTSTAVLAGGGVAFTNTAGTTTLNATNTYGGGTNITGGTLRAVAAGSLGSGLVTLNGGNLSLANDGSGTGLGNGMTQSISYGNDVMVSASQSITVGQFTAGVGTLNAANKTLQLDTLSIGAQTLTVTNSNGFGLEFTGTTTLTGAPTFNVGGGSNAPVVQGLTLSGKVTGAFGITKSGLGTLVLNNNTNDFVGNITIGTNAGLVSVTSDGALGNASNQVSLNLSGAGLQFNLDGGGNGLAANTFAHRINTSAAGGVLDVTQFGTTNPTITNVATLTTAFNGGAASANALSKTGSGILEIAANNNGGTPYTGVITVNAGAIRVSNAGALGAAANNTIVSNAVGSAVQINGVNTGELFNITGSGINTGGAIENFSGTNTLSGAITLGGAATIGATGGGLTLTGGISGAQALTFAGPNNIGITTTAIGAVSSITKIGSGTTTLSVASTGFILPFNVNAGTFQMDNGAKFGNASTAAVAPGATLILDNNVGTNTADRLGGSARTLALSGATFNYTGNGAANSAETTSTLTLSPGQSQITVVAQAGRQADLTFATAAVSRAAGSTVLFRGTSLGTAAGAGVATIKNSVTGFTFIGQAGAANNTNKAILPWAILDVTAGGTGGSFATADTGTAILRPLNTGTEMVTNVFTANTNVLLTSSQTVGTVGATTSINSLTMNNAASQVTVPLGANIQLDSGGLLATVANAGISGGFLNSATVSRELIMHTLGDMTIGSVIGNSLNTYTGPLTKTGAGNLTLSAKNNYTGSTTINQGTLTLGGGNNTLATNKALVVNNGGTLDLGANNQYVGNLSSTGTVEGAGGAITGSGMLTINQSTNNLTFAGNIGDSVNLTLTSSNASHLTFSRANDTSGTLNLLGGRVPNTDPSQSFAPGSGLSLIDGGTLLNVGNIRISQASLNIDNTGTKDMANRVKDTAIITLDGGAILFRGRAQSNSTETLGDVTANSGRSFLTAVAGGTGVNSAQLTLNNLTRNTGASIGLNFGQGSNLGQIGSNTRIVVTGGLSGNLTPVNGVVPGVTVGQTAFVGYAPGLGFGQLGTAGFPANYSGALNAAAATDNVSGASATVVKAGGQTINSLVAGSITFVNATDVLTLASGMLNQGSGFGNAIGTQAVTGRLTSGLSSGELFYYKNGGGGGNGVLGNGPTTGSVINSVITDNGGTRVSLVVQGSDRTNFFGSDQPGMQPAVSAPNTYTGGTFVNGNGASAFGLASFNPGDVVIPAAFDPTKGLVITNAGVTMVTNAGQIAPSNIVTLNGNSLLTYVGNNTQAGIVFNSYGSSSTNSGVPTVTPSGILTITGNISSTPGNVAVVPIISGGTLDLNNSTSHNITVDGGATASSLFHAGNGATVTGLTISSAIASLTPASGGFTKLGTGVLELSGTNTFTGGLNINAGAVKATNASALGGGANVVTLNNNASLWLAGGITGNTLAVSASNGTLASVNGDQSLAGSVVLTGALNVSLADPTLNNVNRNVTLSGAITGTGSLNVTGNVDNTFVASPKFLALTNATSFSNTYSGGTTIGSGGRLRPTASFNMGSTSGSLTVNTGGTLDLNNTSQTVGNFTGTGGTVASFSGTNTLSFTIGNGNGGGGTFNGVIANGTGTVTLTKVGTGTITLSGTNSFGNASNGTTVAGGTLALDFTTATTAAPVLLATAPLTLAGGTLDLRNGAAQVQTVASTTLTGGLSNVTQSSGTSILRMNAITPGVGIVNFGADNIASTTNANNAAGILGGWATRGSTWAVNSGTAEGGGNNYITAYTGGFTNINRLGGVIIGSATNNFRIIEAGGAGDITPFLPGTTDVATLLQSATGGTATYNPGTTDILRVGAAGGILLPSTASALTIGTTAGDGKLTAGGAPATAGTIAITNNHASNLVTVNSIIENNGAGVVTLATAGNVLLNAVNTYTGNTGVGNGTLEIGGAGQLGSGNYGGTIQVALGATFKYNSSANQTLTAAISGGGALVKDGAGNLTVQGTNVFTGGTTVNGGKLILQSATDTFANLGSLTINSGGTVEVLGGNPLWNGTSPDRTITINGGTLTRTFGGTGNQDYRVKSIDMTAGLISSTTVGYMEFFNDAYGLSVPVNTYASANEAVISANWAARNNAGTTTFVFTTADGTTASGVDLLFSGKLAANTVYNVTKAGAGVMAISSDLHSSTVYGTGTFAGYSGTTTISGGTLQLGYNNGTTGSLNPLSTIVNNATLAFDRSNTLTQGTHFNSAISGTGAVHQNGSGTTIFTGDNPYTGVTNVNAGTLKVNGKNTGGGLVTVANGAILGGSGLICSTVTGAGLGSPGNSPGILTIEQTDPSLGLDFAFEFTATGNPTWSNSSASVNDVWRMFDDTAPFINGPFDSDNVIDIYLNVASLTSGDVFRGGFFTDRDNDFLATVVGANYQYWVLGSPADTTFETVGYQSLATYNTLNSTTYSLAVSTFHVPTANFADGDVDNGWVTQFTVSNEVSVVPEPSTLALAALGLIGLGCFAWRRRKR